MTKGRPDALYDEMRSFSAAPSSPPLHPRPTIPPPPTPTCAEAEAARLRRGLGSGPRVPGGDATCSAKREAPLQPKCCVPLHSYRGYVTVVGQMAGFQMFDICLVLPERRRKTIHGIYQVLPMSLRIIDQAYTRHTPGIFIPFVTFYDMIGIYMYIYIHNNNIIIYIYIWYVS
jgi:hypothetical protein